MLPNEDAAKQKIVDELSGIMLVGQTLLAFAIDMLEIRNPGVDIYKSEIMTYRVGNALCAKACKSFRSCLSLAPLGAENDMSLIARSMYEAYVAMCFVFDHSVKLNLPNVDDTTLTNDFRAKLYLAYGAISMYEDFQRHRGNPHIAAELTTVNESNLKRMSDEAEELVGSMWAARFREYPKTYSGLNLSKLSQCIGGVASGWYQRVYGMQSKTMHATDYHNHMVYREAEGRYVFKWQSEPESIKRTLGLCSLMLWGCVEKLNGRYQFAGDTNTELTSGLALLQSLLE